MGAAATPVARLESALAHASAPKFVKFRIRCAHPDARLSRQRLPNDTRRAMTSGKPDTSLAARRDDTPVLTESYLETVCAIPPDLARFALTPPGTVPPRALVHPRTQSVDNRVETWLGHGSEEPRQDPCRNRPPDSEPIARPTSRPPGRSSGTSSDAVDPRLVAGHASGHHARLAGHPGRPQRLHPRPGRDPAAPGHRGAADRVLRPSDPAGDRRRPDSIEDTERTPTMAAPPAADPEPPPASPRPASGRHAAATGSTRSTPSRPSSSGTPTGSPTPRPSPWPRRPARPTTR